MKRLWAPWRMKYINEPEPPGCIFCGISDPCRERHVLHVSPFSFIMLNRYPYTNGHMMVAPHRHTSNLDELSDQEMLDLFRLVRLSRSVLQVIARPQGYNIGINLGRAAGAGVDQHLHVHVVPRWNGDTNFMSVIGDLRVMPESLYATYDKLLPEFISLTGGAHDSEAG